MGVEVYTARDFAIGQVGRWVPARGIRAGVTDDTTSGRHLALRCTHSDMRRQNSHFSP